MPSPLPRRTVLSALLAAVATPGLLQAQTAPQTPPQTPAAEPLQIALAPFLSPGALLAAYEPLRRQLQVVLAQPVETTTARDFKSLMTATRRGEHEVAQLPAHLARLAMVDWGWQMIGAPDLPVTVVVAVRGNGPVQEAAALRGGRIAMLDPLSLTATVGRRWLERQGLGTAVTAVPMPSVNSMLFALDRDEVQAFVGADTQLLSLPAATPRGERVLARVEGIPGPVFLARPGLPPARLEALRRAFLGFQPDPARPTIAANAPLKPLAAAQLAALDDYVVQARRALDSGN